MDTLFRNVSNAVSGAFQEAASMADDMHAIIVADEDAVKKKLQEEEEKKAAVYMPKFISFRKISVTRSAKKEISPCDSLEEEETYAAQPTTSNTEVKQSPPILSKRGRNFGWKIPTTSAKPMKETSACERKKKTNAGQPNGSNTEIEGSPVALAKLMTKVEKQAKHIAKLEQQLSKTKEEEFETRKAIGAVAAKFGDVFDESVASDNNSDQIPDDQTGSCSSFDNSLSDDEMSECEDDETDDDEDVITLALDGTSRQLDSTSRQQSLERKICSAYLRTLERGQK
ncbi:hypothetical protein ACHAWT_008804 [Skeletonema menzelii]|mmetsp:Transcript_10546/g.17450  ORF Transcript_10546/g.17450 Transcript_10546/m.17450 type:complete len:284 (-) Transcript_10546:55-906(-)|eukprot:scaffold30257_cov160-Skeletonema_menzelii.AAC.1